MSLPLIPAFGSHVTGEMLSMGALWTGGVVNKSAITALIPVVAELYRIKMNTFKVIDSTHVGQSQFRKRHEYQINGLEKQRSRATPGSMAVWFNGIFLLLLGDGYCWIIIETCRHITVQFNTRFFHRIAITKELRSDPEFTNDTPYFVSE